MEHNADVLAVDLDVLEVARRRGIEHVLHFTTNLGLVGIFATKLIKARTLLEKNQYLEHLFIANNSIRKDPAWAGYISMSVSGINAEHLRYSRAEHLLDDLWWCVLDLAPAILAHDGVMFVTANNIWPRSERGTGGAGLEALFATRIAGRYSSIHEREAEMPPARTTCSEAEVLYPQEVSTDYLRGIYVQNDAHAADVEAGMSATSHRDVPVYVNEQIFTEGLLK